LKPLGVVTALGAEARALGRLRQTQTVSAAPANLAFLADGSLLAVSGIGAAAAARAASALIDAGVAALMTFGMAGGLDPALAAGSVLLPAEVIARDGTRFATARAWRERLSATLSSQGEVRGGLLLTSDSSIDSREAKAAAFRETCAAAVDMESLFVARIAADHQLPFICVRVIVDTAADTLPTAVVAASRAGRIQIGRLLGGLLSAPGDVAALMRLARRYRSAMQALRLVARAGSFAPLASEVGFA
jgi:adenosylhomocysteine nucleosidase